MKKLGLTFVISQVLGWTATAANLPSYIVHSQKDLTKLQKTLKQSTSPEAAAWLRWQVVLNAPQIGKTDLALSELKTLEKSSQKLVGKDQLALTRGRIQFQAGKFDAALASYQEVPKTSEYWFEALEEQSWSYIRLGQSDKATAKLATLFSPVFQTWVGPETFFAANYNALKVCDYNTVFKNGQLFKERHATRITELEKLAETGENSQTASAVARLQAGEMNFMAFANEASALPRFFWRDEFLRRQAQRKVPSSIISRLQAMAKAELTEYRTVVQKLNLIEAEVIQRLYLDQSLKGVRPDLAKNKSDANVLTFPQSDELWLDEIDAFQAKVKSCPQLKEAKL